MAANPFERTAVPVSVQKELEARRGKNGIQWTAKRFPWIKITSMSALCEKYKTLDSRTTTDLYEPNYIRPLPVVTQVSVTKKGNLGTTKQVNISITAFTDDQLVQLQQCYFIPGLSVRAEWGWSIRAEKLQKTSGPIDSTIELDCKAIPAIMNKQQEDPSYCGVQGTVANFSYKLTDQNFWECTIEITGVAEAFVSTPITGPPCDCPRKVKDENEGEQKTKKVPVFQTWCLDLHEGRLGNYSKDIVNSNVLEPGTVIRDIPIKYNGPERDLSGKSAFEQFTSFLANAPRATATAVAGIIETVSFGSIPATKAIPVESTEERFVNMNYLVGAMNRFFTPPTNDGSKCGTSDLGRISVKDIKINYNQSVLSTDPRVCILPGTPNQDKIFDNSTNTKSCVDKEGKYIILGDILVNVAEVYSLYTSALNGGEPTVESFLMDVLNRINGVCGNLWNFTIVTNTENQTQELKTPVIVPIDLNIKNDGENKLYVLPGSPGTSILRSLDLEMKLTNSMKMQAMYATNTSANQTKQEKNPTIQCAQQSMRNLGGQIKGLEAINKGKEYIEPITPDPRCKASEKITTEEAIKVKTFDEVLEELKDEVTDNTVSTAQEELLKQFSEKAQPETDCDGRPLPFGFKFSLDGIGGLKFGQIIDCDRIPLSVREGYNFQITAVNHTINVNDWVTQVETIALYKSST